MSMFDALMTQGKDIEAERSDLRALQIVDLRDARRFDEVFVRFYAPLCQFATRYVGSAADAEDVVENLFLRLWDRGMWFESHDHARAALYQATYHACLNHQRGQKRTMIREFDYAAMGPIADDSYIPNLLRAELMALVHREIDRLPENYATVLRMSFQDDLNNQEIAEKLQLQVQTVKNYKAKGLALLRQRIPQDVFILLATGYLYH